ncbi:hypothetical protein V5O48_005005 [Marasmius crinis-equi]|uniref:Uncharacterized protein n=1 Tax=Marasmius crinis-equi TaxID=585013 RepID=A0ABR3FNN0_9AGAR
MSVSSAILGNAGTGRAAEAVLVVSEMTDTYILGAQEKLPTKECIVWRDKTVSHHRYSQLHTDEGASLVKVRILEVKKVRFGAERMNTRSAKEQTQGDREVEPS